MLKSIVLYQQKKRSLLTIKVKRTSVTDLSNTFFERVIKSHEFY